MKQQSLKIMTIFGTRPEIIRLSCVFKKLDEHLNHIMVHTGQSYDYEMNQVFFDDLEIRKPDYFLEVKADTIGKQIANIIEKSEEVLIKEKPDAVLILGDTNSALASICAKRMRIPIFHMEAGNRCFDENVPEEINRRIVDCISDINLPYSENARLNLIQEGAHAGSVYVTGSPMAEILSFYKEKIDSSDILKKLKISENKYFVASIHRQENVVKEESLKEIIGSLEAVADKYKLPILVSTHPRTQKEIKKLKIKTTDLVRFHKPFGYFDYICLQKNAFCVLSDSGSIIEESSILKFPAIQIRNSSERPEGYDEGVSILSGLNEDMILKSIDIVTTEFAQGIKFNIPRNYQDTNVSSKVLRHIISLIK